MKKLRLINSLLLALFAIYFISCASSNTVQSPSRTLSKSIVYTPAKKADKPDMSKVKTEIEAILKRAEIIDEKKADLNMTSNDILVSDDKIEIKAKDQTTTINFADLINHTIDVKRLFYPNVRVKPTSAGTYSLWAKVNGKLTQIVYKPYQVQFKELISFNFGEYNLEDAKRLADGLFYIQNLAAKKQTNSQLSQFEAMAAQYRALKVKPPVSEEQRRYIVQANSFNQEKNYIKAIELYTKAIEMDQTAYPSAYMNLALLSAQVSKFDVAIFNMKKYLLLEPEAKDARSAQDKIYEWEVKLDK